MLILSAELNCISKTGMFVILSLIQSDLYKNTHNCLDHPRIVIEIGNLTNFLSFCSSLPCRKCGAIIHESILLEEVRLPQKCCTSSSKLEIDQSLEQSMQINMKNQ